MNFFARVHGWGRRPITSLPRVRLSPRSLFSELVELSGLACIVYGVETVNRPAGFIVGGLLAVVFAAALDRRLR